MKINISDKFEGFNDFLLESMNKWNVPGMAVGVIKGTDVIFLGEAGLRDVKQGLKVTKDTIFAIGSASKAFTTLAVGILVDEGRLDLDTPIKKYMPDFEMHNKYAEDHLTLRDMLCHRSGLPRHDLLWYNSPLSRKELISKTKYLESNKDFRETWQYNNIMYAAAGYIIELVTGMTWEEFVKARILDPLEMNSTNFSVEVSKNSKDYSQPYAQKGTEVHQIDFRNIDVAGPAGSINSSLTDMTKWLMLHLNKGKVNGKQIISEKTLSELHSPQIPCQLVPWNFDEIQFSSYGLGWFVESYRGRKHVNHGGNIDGFSAYISFLPQENLGIIILSNLKSPFWTIPINYSIFNRLLGYESVDWNERIQNEFAKMVKSIEAANLASKTSQKEDSVPAHPLEEYIGCFKNPGYGTINIEKDGDKLKLTYNNIEYVLKHKCYDIFTMTMMEYYVITVTFGYDNNGDIKGISIPFEQSVKEIVFDKCKQHA